MEMLVVELVLALLKAVPPMVQAIQASTTMSEAEKAKVMADLHVRLEDAKARVAAVKFRDV